MKFSLPADVQAQVKRYDPQVRALAELEEALNKPASKQRKTRTYRRGNPANLIPLDVIDADETVALQMYQEMIKNISDDTETTTGHIIYEYHSEQSIAGDCAYICYYRNLWFAAWIPPVDIDGKRPYVYGMSFAYKDNATANKVVPEKYLLKEHANYSSIARKDGTYLFNRDDMISYSVGRTAYKHKTVFFTEHDIKQGWGLRGWRDFGDSKLWDLEVWSKRTNDFRQISRRFKAKLRENQRRFKFNDDPFIRLIEGDPSLGLAVAQSRCTKNWLHNKTECDDFKNEVDWYLNKYINRSRNDRLNYDEKADAKLKKLLSNKVIRREMTEICQKLQEDYSAQCRSEEAYFADLTQAFDPLESFFNNTYTFAKIYPDVPVDYLLANKTVLTAVKDLAYTLTSSEPLLQYLRENVPVTTTFKHLTDSYNQRELRRFNSDKEFRPGVLYDTWSMLNNLLERNVEVTKPRRWRLQEWHDHIMAINWKQNNAKVDLPQCLFPAPVKLKRYVDLTWDDSQGQTEGEVDETYTFLQPLHTHMLAEWGRAVKNCVGSHGYADQIKEYKAMIVLVMVDQQPKFTIQCCVEGSEMTVTQIASVCNRSLTYEEKNTVEETFQMAIDTRQAQLVYENHEGVLPQP